MKRLYALAMDNTSNYVFLSDILDAMQDGNQQNSLYRIYLTNLLDKDFRLRKDEFKELISGMYEDFKIISTYCSKN